MNEAAAAHARFSNPYETAGPRLGPGIGPDGTYTPTGRVLAFLAGLWTMIAFFPLLFPAAILYTKAEYLFLFDPERARGLVQWSWLCATVFPLIGAAVTAAVVLIVRG